MSRRFEINVIPANSGYVTLTPDAVANLVGGPLSIALIFKLDSVTGDKDLFIAKTAGDAATVWGVNQSGGQVFYTIGAPFVGGGTVLPNTWYLLGITKAPGSSQVREHLCNMETDAWTHVNRGVLNDTAGPIDHIYFGRAFGAYMGGYAALAAAGNEILDDAAWEAIRPGLAQWLAAGFDALWKFNDTPVDDLVGNADQIAIQGTSVDLNVEPPNFSYDLAPEPPTPTPTPTPASADGYRGYLTMLRTLSAEYQQDLEQEQRSPVACPNDGELLRSKAGGALYCPYDGWQPDN